MIRVIHFPFLLLRQTYAVAPTTYRVNEFRASVLINLVPYAIDRYVYKIATRVRMMLPNMVQDFAARDPVTGMQEEKFQKSELLGC